MLNTYVERNPKNRYVYITGFTLLYSCTTQHCKSTIFQLKKNIRKIQLIITEECYTFKKELKLDNVTEGDQRRGQPRQIVQEHAQGDVVRRSDIKSSREIAGEQSWAMRTETRPGLGGRAFQKAGNGKFQAHCVAGTGLVYPKDRRMTRIALGKIGGDSQEAGDDRLQTTRGLGQDFSSMATCWLRSALPNSNPWYISHFKAAYPKFHKYFPCYIQLQKPKNRACHHQPCNKHLGPPAITWP